MMPNQRLIGYTGSSQTLYAIIDDDRLSTTIGLLREIACPALARQLHSIVCTARGTVSCERSS